MLRASLFVMCLPGLLAQAWKDKPVAAWTEDDARVVMAESPWVKSVTPEGGGTAGPSKAKRVESVLGQMGGVRMGRMGMPGPRRMPSGRPEGPREQRASVVTVRWESALPVREAELKARDTSAPTVDDGFYVLAVYRLPRDAVRAGMEKKLAKLGVLRRDGMKDLQAARVRVLAREDGPVVVYLFSRTEGIRESDRRVEFSGEVSKWTVGAAFFTEDMRVGGKLEI